MKQKKQIIAKQQKGELDINKATETRSRYILTKQQKGRNRYQQSNRKKKQTKQILTKQQKEEVDKVDFNKATKRRSRQNRY